MAIGTLDTSEACLKYARKVCRELAGIETEHEAWKRMPEIECNEVALWQAGVAMNSLRDHVAEAVHEAMRGWAALKAEEANRGWARHTGEAPRHSA